MWFSLVGVLLVTETLALNLTLPPSFADLQPLRYPSRKSYVRRQRAIPLSTPFPCEDSLTFGRSATVPTSVHKVRPGDIEVVAAIGDSLVAGNGALEEQALGAFFEYRGVSWCAGGDATWREYITLPNILKEYNPRLRGYSTGTGEWLVRNARLNVAFPVASDLDALKQARVLVARMRQSADIDMAHDWKMVTIFMGANDLCSASCVSPVGWSPAAHAGKLVKGNIVLVARMRQSADIDMAHDWKMVTIFMGANDLCSASCVSPVGWSPAAHAGKLARALDYLYANLKRTIVNLVPVLDVSVSIRVGRGVACRAMHALFCGCFHRGGGELRALVAAARNYQRAERKLIESGRYDGRDDFTVIFQPFMQLFNAPFPPRLPLTRVIHQSYITHDCFHFSQKGHALAANLLWNNMLEPIGNKTDNFPPVLLKSFKCPTRNAPYIFTHKNSKIYLKTGRQDTEDDNTV